MSVPAYIEQRDRIKKYMKEPLNEGDVWYVIDKKWWLKWKNYVHYDDGAENFELESALLPGPIDNRTLLDHPGRPTKQHLLYPYDCELVPEKAWKCLAEFYSTVQDDCGVFKRKVMLVNNEPWIEVNPYNFKIVKSETKKSKNAAFSGKHQIQVVHDFIREEFHVLPSKEVRLHIEDTWPSILSVEPNCLLEDSGIPRNAVITFDEKNPSTNASPVSSFNGTTIGTRSSSRSTELSTTPGLCGLSNFGNTCFMNSALQSMSNVQPLTEYFLEDKWERDKNPQNPLGMGGEIAETYAALMKVMWSGEVPSTVPRAFKTAVSKFAPRFCGFLQHDAQELLLFMLDGLHEDLNRIKADKPYVELKDAAGRRDEEVAKEAWKNHKKRNDSIIVDLFHGLLKSHVRCPDCAYVSVTFDPFCCLSLPLPNNLTVKKTLRFVPAPFTGDQFERFSSVQISVTVPKQGLMRDFAEIVGKLMQVNPKEIKMTEVYNRKIYKEFSETNRISEVKQNDELYFYHLPKLSLLAGSDGNFRACPVLHESQRIGHTCCPTTFFGDPMHIMLDTNCVTYNAVVTEVVRYFGRFVEFSTVTLDRKTGEVSSRSKDAIDNDLGGSDGEMGSTDQDEQMDLELCQNGLVTELDMSPYFTIFHDGPGEYQQKELLHGNPIRNCSRRKFTIYLKWTPAGRELYEKYAARVERQNVSTSTDQRPVDLKECFHKFTQEEKLVPDNEWYCRRCKEHKEAYKKIDLWQLPPILIIHLKRFSSSYHFREKKDTAVSYPIENLDITEWTLNDKSCIYDLVAVINHMGVIRNGHYTAYAKNNPRNEWFHFNDSLVTPASRKDVCVNKNAYVLIYKRKDPVSLDRMLSHNSDSSVHRTEIDGWGIQNANFFSPE